MALLAVALGKSTIGGGEEPDLSKAMLDAAAPPGEGIRWDELESASNACARAKISNYSGLTGPLAVDSCGARSTGITSN